MLRAENSQIVVFSRVTGVLATNVSNWSVHLSTGLPISLIPYTLQSSSSFKLVRLFWNVRLCALVDTCPCF
jgi:hypothetical protein